jgi:hypothetical protein
MADEYGNLKYPPKTSKVREEYVDTLTTPGTVKQCVSFTFPHHKYLNV